MVSPNIRSSQEAQYNLFSVYILFSCYCFLVQSMVMYDNDFDTKKSKLWTTTYSLKYIWGIWVWRLLRSKQNNEFLILHLRTVRFQLLKSRYVEGSSVTFREVNVWHTIGRWPPNTSLLWWLCLQWSLSRLPRLTSRKAAPHMYRSTWPYKGRSCSQGFLSFVVKEFLTGPLGILLNGRLAHLFNSQKRR